MDRYTFMNWPEWWNWELEFTPHVEKRMLQRDFSEIDLRTMLDTAKSYMPDIIEGRWIIDTNHRNRNWQVIVEPDPIESLLVVIAAYST